MSDCIEKKISSTHQIQTVAVNNYFTQQQQQYDEMIENYQQLCQKLQNYSNLINGLITKILALINRYIEKLQSEFSNFPQPQDQVMKQDSLIVTQNEKLSQVTIFIESKRDFQLLIQEQIQKQSFEYQNLEIIDQIQKLLKIQKSEENASTIIDKDNQTKKTLSLECLPDVKVQLPRLIKQIINTLIYPLRYFQYPIKQGSIFYSNHQRQMVSNSPTLYIQNLSSHQNLVQHQSIQYLQLVLMEKQHNLKARSTNLNICEPNLQIVAKKTQFFATQYQKIL